MQKSIFYFVLLEFTAINRWLWYCCWFLILFRRVFLVRLEVMNVVLRATTPLKATRQRDFYFDRWNSINNQDMEIFWKDVVMDHAIMNALKWQWSGTSGGALLDTEALSEEDEKGCGSFLSRERVALWFGNLLQLFVELFLLWLKVFYCNFYLQHFPFKRYLTFLVKFNSFIFSNKKYSIEGRFTSPLQWFEKS